MDRATNILDGLLDVDMKLKNKGPYFDGKVGILIDNNACGSA